MFYTAITNCRPMARWMLFRQVGFENIKLLKGGYSYYKEHQNDLQASKNDDTYLKGTARYDLC